MNPLIEARSYSEEPLKKGSQSSVESKLPRRGIAPRFPIVTDSFPAMRVTQRGEPSAVLSTQDLTSDRNHRNRHPSRQFVEFGGVRLVLPRSVEHISEPQRVLLTNMAESLTDGYKQIAYSRLEVREKHRLEARKRRYAKLSPTEKAYVIGAPLSALVHTAKELWPQYVHSLTKGIKNPFIRNASRRTLNRLLPLGTILVAAGLFLVACGGGIASAYDPDRPTSTPHPVDTQIAPAGQHSLISADSPLLTNLTSQGIANHCLVDTATYQNLRPAEITQYQTLFSAAAGAVLTLPDQFKDFKCEVKSQKLTAYFIGNSDNDVMLVKPDGKLVPAIRQADGVIIETKPETQLTPSPNPPGNEVVYPPTGAELRWNETQFGTKTAEYLQLNDPYKADAQRIVAMLSQLATTAGFQQNRLEFVGSIGKDSWVIALKYDGKLWIPKREGLLIAPITPYNFLNEFAANPALFSLEDVEPPSGYTSGDLIIVEDKSTFHVIATRDQKYFLDLGTSKWRNVKDGSEFVVSQPTSIPPTPTVEATPTPPEPTIRYIGGKLSVAEYTKDWKVAKTAYSSPEDLLKCVSPDSILLQPEKVPNPTNHRSQVVRDVIQSGLIGYTARFAGIVPCDWHKVPNLYLSETTDNYYLYGIIFDTPKGPVLYVQLATDGQYDNTLEWAFSALVTKDDGSQSIVGLNRSNKQVIEILSDPRFLGKVVLTTPANDRSLLFPDRMNNGGKVDNALIALVEKGTLFPQAINGEYFNNLLTFPYEELIEMGVIKP